MDAHEIERLAERLLAGDLSVEQFAMRVAHPAIANTGEAQLDLDRARRCGFPEVVFAQGKTVAALEKIFHTLVENGVDVLATRMLAEQAAALGPKFPGGCYNPVARTFRILDPETNGEPPGSRGTRHDRDRGDE